MKGVSSAIRDVLRSQWRKRIDDEILDYLLANMMPPTYTPKQYSALLGAAKLHSFPIPHGVISWPPEEPVCLRIATDDGRLLWERGQ